MALSLGATWPDPELAPPQPGAHSLRARSFPAPTKCLRCTSLMLGLARQGLGCDSECLPVSSCTPDALASLLHALLTLGPAWE